MPKVSKEEKRRRRLERTKNKADFLFMVYRFLGPDRTLKKLAEIVHLTGITLSEKTLGRYSARFDWQRRILEVNAQDKDRREKAVAAQVEQMNQRHVQFAQGLLGLAAGGLNFFQQLMRDTDRGKTLHMSIPDLIQLYRTAQSGERLARGQATNRVEIWVDVASTVVEEFSMIFLAVNDISDPAERKTEFIRLADDMVRRYYTEAQKQLTEGRRQAPGSE
jgi:hypothetical protein